MITYIQPEDDRDKNVSKPRTNAPEVDFIVRYNVIKNQYIFTVGMKVLTLYIRDWNNIVEITKVKQTLSKRILQY